MDGLLGYAKFMLHLTFLQFFFAMGDLVLTSQTQLVMYCTPIITDIMIIQQERDLRMNAMQDASHKHKAERISRDRHDHLFERWHQTEGELRSEANDLYIKAEAQGCL